MATQMNRLSDHQKELYHRNIIIPEIDEAGQLKLLHSRILVVGLGGLGSPALLYLAAAGVGKIGILDDDRVELSNLQRQILHGRDDIGNKKTVSACESIARLNPDVELTTYPFRLTASNAAEIIAAYDFIIEATDNFESKFLINDISVKTGKAFSHAGILGTYGQTMTVIPDQGPCFRCIFKEVPPPGAVKTTAEIGVLGTIPGVFGAIQATEAIKYLVGCGDLLVGRLLSWDALNGTFREVQLPSDMRCNVCGVA
jgi:molybdopterin/thiamine biosynthesis adenylyltransferase